MAAVILIVPVPVTVKFVVVEVFQELPAALTVMVPEPIAIVLTLDTPDENVPMEAFLSLKFNVP